MIRVTNLSKRFNKQVIFSSLTFEINKYGLIGIVGPSGSGKSTLLNLIAGLDLDYEGKIYLFGQDIKKMSSKELDLLRYQRIGFVFQDYGLLKFHTVKENLEMKNPTLDRYKEVVSKCGLLELVDKKVENLSGGEKQRVAIARAIINQPEILLCDEPTGALDNKSKVSIMKLLKNLSKSMLVIIVSHDIELLENFTKEKIEFCDNLVDVDIKKSRISLITKKKKTKNSLSLKFLFQYAIHHIKAKKYRTMIHVFVFSLALTLIGFSYLVTSSISMMIKDSMSSLINPNQITLKKKMSEEPLLDLRSASEEQVEVIKDQYIDYISGIGTAYFANFEELFIDENYAELYSGNYKISFNELGARHISEYTFAHNIEQIKGLYPSNIKTLTSSQFIIKLRAKDIKRITSCLGLNELTINGLSTYMENQSLRFCFYFANESFYYSDEILLECVGFVLSDDDQMGIIHTDDNFNKKLFEDEMRLPTSDDLTKIETYPYTLKKAITIRCRKNYAETFFEKVNYDSRFINYDFNVLEKENFPLLCSNKTFEEIGTFYITIHDRKRIHLSSINEIMKKENVKSFTLGNNASYIIQKESFIEGFIRPMFITNHLDKMISFTDEVNKTEYDLSYVGVNTLLDNQDILYSSVFTSNSEEAIKYQTQHGEVNIGSNPTKYTELVLSTALAKRLFPNVEIEKIIYEDLYLGYLKNVVEKNGSYQNEIEIIKMKISGLISSDELTFYQDELWTMKFIIFNRIIPSYSFQIDQVIFDMEGEEVNYQLLDKLNQKYPDFIFDSPLLEINKSIDEVIVIVEQILLIFGSFTIFGSFIMLSLICYLYTIETRRELGMMKAIGVNKNSIVLNYMIHSFALGGTSYLSNCITLICSQFFIGFFLKDYFGSEITFSFSIKPFSMTFIFFVAISIIGPLMSIRKPLKMKPIEILKKH